MRLHGIIALLLVTVSSFSQTATKFNPFTGRLDYIGLPNPFKSCADAGSNDTYACNLSPAIGSYETGGWYWFKANTANTGAATLNFNSLGAKTIKKFTAASPGSDLADNDIRAGQWVHVVYDGTNFQMLSAVGNAGGGSGTVTVDGGGSLTSNSFVFGAGTTVTKTLAGFTSDGTSAATFGVAGTGTGKLTLAGTTSGSAAISVAAAAGTPNPILLPTATATANDVLISDGANPQQTAWNPFPLSYAFGNNASINPADGSTQYTGCADVAAASTAAVNRCVISRTGTIIRACVMISVAGTLGDSATGTIAVRLNNTSNTNITTSAQWTAATQTYCADISVAVVQGDYFEIQVACPTWATTNPTTVRYFGVVVVK